MLTIKKGEKLDWTFDGNVTGSSSDDKTVKATFHGKTLSLEALKPGTATISVTRTDGSSSSIGVTVTA